MVSDRVTSRRGGGGGPRDGDKTGCRAGWGPRVMRWASGREGNWLIPAVSTGMESPDGRGGNGRSRSTTPRTTRTCVCKTITRVHALARADARSLTYAYIYIYAPARLIYVATTRRARSGLERYRDL